MPLKSQLVMAPEWESLLQRHGLDSVEGVYALNSGTVITQSGTTQVVRWEVSGAKTGSSLFIKKYWFPTVQHRIRGMFRGTLFGQSKAPREFRNLMRLQELGLNAPPAVAFGEERKAGWLTRSFLISAGIEKATALDLFLQETLPAVAAAEQARLRGQLVVALARQTRRMHEHRFVHHDYFWRNIILSGDSIEHFYLIDAHKGHEWAHGEGDRFRAQDLAALDAPAPWFFRRGERLRFFLQYRNHDRLSDQDKRLLRRILKLAEPMREAQRRRLRGNPTPPSPHQGCSSPEVPTLTPRES